MRDEYRLGPALGHVTVFPAIVLDCPCWSVVQLSHFNKRFWRVSICVDLRLWKGAGLSIWVEVIPSIHMTVILVMSPARCMSSVTLTGGSCRMGLLSSWKILLFTFSA